VTSILLGITGTVAFAVSKFTNGKLAVIITSVGLLGCVIALIILAVRQKTLGAIFKAIAIVLFSTLIGTYVILGIFLFFFQDAVANQTSSFFQPKTISAEVAQSFLSADTSALDLTLLDGTHLRGWLVQNSPTAHSPLIIYFGGSGSESSELIPLVKGLNGWTIALLNYRGFGLSDGVPTQANVLSDALFIFDSLSKRQDINPQRIIAMGYSLGTGVAVYLSAQRPTAATILASPYDRWSLIGVKQSPIYSPLKGLLKPYFNSIGLAPAIKTPLLSLIGARDTFVKPELSRKLTDAWGGTAKVLTYPGAQHDLLFRDNSSWVDIANFLSTIK
jgi:pimeloyl-ACP methyl ester carboxylesterase